MARDKRLNIRKTGPSGLTFLLPFQVLCNSSLVSLTFLSQLQSIVFELGLSTFNNIVAKRLLDNSRAVNTTHPHSFTRRTVWAPHIHYRCLETVNCTSHITLHYTFQRPITPYSYAPSFTYTTYNQDDLNHANSFHHRYTPCSTVYLSCAP